MAAAAFVCVIYALGAGWRPIVLAIVTANWCGGIIANASQSTRAWRRRRILGRRIFIAAHLAEMPIVRRLAEGGLTFRALMLALGAKLSVFMLGREPRREGDRQV